MSAEEKLYDALAAEALRLNRKLQKTEWLAVARPILAAIGKERKKAAVAAGAEAIYEAYPKKVGRDDALKAISAALKKHPPEYLLDKTQQFAAAVNSWPSSYRYKTDGRDTCPHPATWFNQGRFQDDPREWRRAGARSGPDRPTAVSAPTAAQEEAAQQEADALRARYLAMPEPEKGSFEHSLWLEARRNVPVADVAAAMTAPILAEEDRQKHRRT